MSRLTVSDVADLDYQTTPRDQGQIVTYSYALYGSNFPGVLVCRRYDASDRSTSYTAQKISRRATDDSFEPWNGVLPPTVGKEMAVRS